MLHTVCLIWKQIWEQKKTANHIFLSKLWKKVNGRPNLILLVHLLFLFLPWAFSFGTFPLWITAALETHENPLWIYDTRLKKHENVMFQIHQGNKPFNTQVMFTLLGLPSLISSESKARHKYLCFTKYLCRWLLWSKKQNTLQMSTENVTECMWPLGVSVELVFRAQPAYLSSNVEARRLLSAATGSSNTVNIWMFLPHLW